MRSIKILFALLTISLINFSCEPEALPDNQPQIESNISEVEKTASGDEENPIDDDKSDD